MIFEELWLAYPVEDQPCLDVTGRPAFENQCAIRMGAALAGVGIDLSAYDGQTCWHGHGGQHILRAEELMTWLSSTPGFWSLPETYEGVGVEALAGRRGIIMCQNFWGTGNQGDHIDLWDGFEMRHGSPDYMKRSERVVFWEVCD